jgi:hypothetical protein
MTREYIIRMVQEIAAQYSKADHRRHWTHDYMMNRLMELVAVSAEEEREACAKLIETYPVWIGDNAKREIAAAIRARGTNHG